MESSDLTLEDLGWREAFSSQLTADERGGDLCPVRVMAVHRGWIEIAGSGLGGMIPPRCHRRTDRWTAPLPVTG
ncbi:hypothetical protein ACFSLT_07650 [Novosphingobium resinovorum]